MDWSIQICPVCSQRRRERVRSTTLAASIRRHWCSHSTAPRSENPVWPTNCRPMRSARVRPLRTIAIFWAWMEAVRSPSSFSNAQMPPSARRWGRKMWRATNWISVALASEAAVDTLHDSVPIRIRAPSRFLLPEIAWIWWRRWHGPSICHRPRAEFHLESIWIFPCRFRSRSPAEWWRNARPLM